MAPRQCLNWGAKADQSPPNAEALESFACTWTLECGRIALAGSGVSPETFAFSVDTKAAGCGVDRATQIEAAFLAAFLKCDKDDARSASISRLMEHPVRLDDTTAKLDAAAQLAQSDIKPVCGAMHGLRRVYEVNGHPYEDVILRQTPFH